MQKYNIVASTDVDKGSVGHWDIEIANKQTLSRCQDVVVPLVGEYAGGVWFQSIDTEKPTDAEVAERLAETNAEI